MYIIVIMYIHTYIHPNIHVVLNQPLPSHPQNAVATKSDGVRGNIFGSNLGRLQQIKAKYDPNNAPGQQGPSKHFFISSDVGWEQKIKFRGVFF